MKTKSRNKLVYLINSVSKVRFFLCLIILFPLTRLGWQILEKNYPELDRDFLVILQKNINPVFTKFCQIIYYVSGMHVTAMIVALSLGILVWKRYWQEAKVLAFATLGILILIDEILKPFFDRRRPESPRLVEVSGSKSFPSGHAAGNLVLYFYLSFLIAAHYPKLTIYIYGLATIFLILIGLSSMYVKAHWLTDIIAGYGFGYIWLTICLTILNLLTRKYRKQN